MRENVEVPKEREREREREREKERERVGELGRSNYLNYLRLMLVLYYLLMI